MPNVQHHLQNAVDAIISPAATAVSATAASGTVVMWATNWRESVHANAQTAVDLGAYMACLWFAVQIVCKLYATFLSKGRNGDS